MRYLPMCLLLWICAAALGGDGRIIIGAFSVGDLEGWTPKRFHGQTRYEPVSADGRIALKAESRDAASGLYKKVRIDLDETPYLHWSWRVENTLGDIDEHNKRGDDYPARIYVVFSGGLFFWKTRAVNYVWSNSQPEGTVWENAYTGNAGMIAVGSGTRKLGEWVTERRDVRADYRRLFGEDVRYVDAVAIMTDTDDSGKSATAYYGDIYFAPR